MKSAEQAELYAPMPVFELVPRDHSLVSSTNFVKISDMPSNGVIVAVNGYPLTKSFYETAVALKQRSLLRNSGLNSFEISKMAEDFAIDYPRNFVAQRLMVDDAIAKGVVTTNEVDEYVINYLAESARRQNKTPEELERKFGKAARYMKYEQAVTFIMGKLIAAKIPPKREVDDAFVEDVRKSVLAENEATAASNAVKRANLGHLRKLIADREITFEKARSKFSEIKEEDLPDGTWGEFERGDEEIKPFAKAVFGVREGEMTGILEDDDNFYILKIAYVSPEKAGAEAIGVVQPEKRTVSRIAFRKSPPFIVQSREDLKKDLQSQMQIQAIEEYANTLLTNGQNKVVYPNGMH